MEIRKPKIVEKIWGHEEVLADNNLYCGKKLHLKEGYRCSIHKHSKIETFYIEKGMVYLELGDDSSELKGILLRPGEIIDISSDRLHRFSGLENSIILETSTSDKKSERETESEKIPNFESWKKMILDEYSGRDEVTPSMGG